MSDPQRITGLALSIPVDPHARFTIEVACERQRPGDRSQAVDKICACDIINGRVPGQFERSLTCALVFYTVFGLRFTRPADIHFSRKLTAVPLLTWCDFRYTCCRIGIASTVIYATSQQPAPLF
jgi:hypothetical protein